jgi:hypothetical protein
LPNKYELIINEAIEELNLSLDAESQILNNENTPLMGQESSLDSLILVRLLITIERISEENYGETISVIDESAFEDGGKSFSTIGSLKQYLIKRFSER